MIHGDGEAPRSAPTLVNQASTPRIRVGTDVVDIGRFRESLVRSPRLLTRVFVEEEIAYLSNKADPVPSFAARFAAKEAVMKVLGVGLGGIAFHDMVIRSLPTGQPQVMLVGEGKKLALGLGVHEVALSISHSGLSALAVATAVIAMLDGTLDEDAMS